MAARAVRALRWPGKYREGLDSFHRTVAGSIHLAFEGPRRSVCGNSLARHFAVTRLDAGEKKSAAGTNGGADGGA
jgi:hypothetical protein